MLFLLKTTVLLPRDRVILAGFGPMVFLLPKFLHYLAFKSFDYERSWWQLFQKHVVRIKLDVYVLLL